MHQKKSEVQIGKESVGVSSDFNPSPPLQYQKHPYHRHQFYTQIEIDISPPPPQPRSTTTAAPASSLSKPFPPPPPSLLFKSHNAAFFSVTVAAKSAAFRALRRMRRQRALLLLDLLSTIAFSAAVVFSLNLALPLPLRSIRSVCPDEGKPNQDGLASVFEQMERVIAALHEDKKFISIIIDDISFLEVAANGSSSDVLNLLHYCHTLTSEYGCAFIELGHKDIYLNGDNAAVILEMEYYADILVRAEPLSTGLAKDVHGQNDVGGLKGNLVGKVFTVNKVEEIHLLLGRLLLCHCTLSVSKARARVETKGQQHWSVVAGLMMAAMSCHIHIRGCANVCNMRKRVAAWLDLRIVGPKCNSSLKTSNETGIEEREESAQRLWIR
ncbi:hypothetical protein Fmac_033015 [Flemingia macrophylla]|uniref:Uncharacterized protein n=1 Tax=Flemingia macrophylla TaxID=520843 RepID=A0ABD1L6K0_9FABA